MGRLRLYRRLYACAKVLALIAAGTLGIVYWNRPQMIQLHPIPAAQRMESFSSCNRRGLLAELRYARESLAIRRASKGRRRNRLRAMAEPSIEMVSSRRASGQA